MKWIPDSETEGTIPGYHSLCVVRQSERKPTCLVALEFDNDDYNLFVRLVPSFAKELYENAIERCNSSNAINGSRNYNGWAIHTVAQKSAFCQSGVEFLPLAITAKDTTNNATRTIYVSYNGGDLVPTSPSNLYEADNIIDIPSCFNIPSNTCVSVQVLTAIRDSKDLLIEPVSVDDWELLEANADWLEGGGLLQQICIVYPDQIIPLWVSGRDVAYVRVLSSNFDPLTTDEENNVWPVDDNSYDKAVDDTCAEPRCLRLVSDTQVIVTPKSRESTESSKVSPSLRLFPTREDCIANDAMLQLERMLHVKQRLKLVTLPPYTVAVNPNTISRIPGFTKNCEENPISRIILQTSSSERSSNIMDKPNPSSFVRMLTSSNIPENHISIHPLVRLQIKAKLYTDYVTAIVLTSSETKKIATVIPNLLRGGELRLCLHRVQINRILDKPLSSWFYPEKFSVDSEFSIHGLVGRGDSDWDVEQSDISSHHVVGDLPIDIGGFVNSSYLEQSDTKFNLYSLSAVHNRSDTSEGIDCDCFIFASDLRSSLSLPTRYDVFHPIKEKFYNQTVHVSSILTNPLPSSTILTSFFESLVTKLPLSSVIISGEKGSGKTTTAMLIASCDLMARGSGTIYLDCVKLKSARGVRMSTILDELTACFDNALKVAPSVLVLDDLDELTPSFDEHIISDEIAQMQQRNPVAVDQSKIITDVIRYFFRRINSMHGQRKVSVIVTCRRSVSLPKLLVADGCFDAALDVPQLSPIERDKLFLALLSNHMVITGNSPGSSIDFGMKTHGYRPRDIEQLINRVVIRMASLPHAIDIDNVISEELKYFVPLGRLGVSTEQKKNFLSWSEIGGLFQAKAELTSIIIRPSKYRRIYMSSEIRLPRGVLLYGPPGTGKSLLPSALAKECGYQLVTCRGPELLDKYIGASEAKVRELFTRAASAAPAIIFLDELDSLAPRRGTDHTGVTDRIVNQLLTFLDGVEDTSNSGSVYVMAATSRPDKVDPALLRPGRLEKHVYVGYSETNDEWTDLIGKISINYNMESCTQEEIWSGCLVEKLQKESYLHPRLSGADLNAIFNSARLAAVHEALSANLTKEPVKINICHLVNSFSLATPALAESDYYQLQRVYSLFKQVDSAVDVGNASRKDPEDKSLRIALR